VEDQERPHQHQRVPQAEHVRPRPAGGDGEDVAENSDVSVTNEIRVGEFAGGRVESGGSERAARRGHYPAVGRDRDEVEQSADGDDPHEAQIEVPHDASGGQAVGRDVGGAVERLVALRHDRDEQHLDREGDHHEPQAAELQLGQPAQPSSRHRDRDEQQEEGEGEGH
jgi:hypothetical protein